MDTITTVISGMKLNTAIEFWYFDEALALVNRLARRGDTFSFEPQEFGFIVRY